jgi:hypothetical protein
MLHASEVSCNFLEAGRAMAVDAVSERSRLFDGKWSKPFEYNLE